MKYSTSFNLKTVRGIIAAKFVLVIVLIESFIYIILPYITRVVTTVAMPLVIIMLSVITMYACMM